MGRYLESGYPNMPEMLDRDGANMIFIIGARGTGKTFSILQEMTKRDKNFLLVRRTAKELKAIRSADLNPYKALNAETGTNIGMFSMGDDGALIATMEENEKGKLVPGEKYGIAVALSTFATIRSFSGNDVNYIVYDEFIPEEHVRTIKHEANALFNLWETVGRNRELQGRDPVKLVCMANSNHIANPYFIALGLVRKVAEMKRKKKHYCFFPGRKIAVYDLSDSPISEQKKNTALYQAVGTDNDFSRMALENEFHDLISANVQTMPLKLFSPIARVGEVCLYKHKNPGKGDYKYYVSNHVSGSPEVFGSSVKEQTRFQHVYKWLQFSEMFNEICYEDSVCEVIFHAYLGLDW